MNEANKSYNLRTIGIVSIGLAILCPIRLIPSVLSLTYGTGIVPTFDINIIIVICLLLIAAGLSVFILKRLTAFLYTCSLAIICISLIYAIILGLMINQLFALRFALHKSTLIYHLLFYGPLFLVSADGIASSFNRRISLLIPLKIKQTIYIFILLYMFYSIISYYGYEFVFDHHEFMSFSILYVFALVLIATLYFILSELLQRRGKDAILPAIQIALIFSILPYIVPESFQPWFFAKVYLNMFSLIMFYCVIISPEIFGFIGLASLRLKKWIPGIIFIAIAVIASTEVLPIRQTFRFDFTEVRQRVWNPECNWSFGTRDRESEFRRSLNMIQHLIAISDGMPTNSLQGITLYIPDIKTYPNILKIDNGKAKLPYQSLSPPFIEQNVMLHTKIDSDSDGLSDFEEAMLLSDGFNRDTDGDGIEDNKDSDPLNPIIESEIAQINAAVIEYLAELDENSVCIIRNEFHRGKGEVANFDKHIILLYGNQSSLWYTIFGWKSCLGYSPPKISIGRHLFDFLRNIVVVDVTYDDRSGLLLLIRKQSKWQVIAERYIGV